MKVKKFFVAAIVTALLVPSMAMAADNGAANPNAKTPASDLRATLSQLLSTHFEYQALTTLREYQGTMDADTAKEMLEENADEMTAAVKSIYGQAGADQFADIFSSQYDDSADLGTAVKNGNTTQEAQVKQDLLQDFPAELGNFLGKATGGNLPAATATGVLSAHEKDVQDFFYSYIRGDYDAAYNYFNTGFKRMSDIGSALAGAIVKQFPDKFDNTVVSTPANDLRGTLDQLLAIHFFYQSMTTLEQYKGAPDAEIVRENLETNADEMTAAVKSLYGQAGADQFAQIFSSQYSNSADLGAAVKNNNMTQEDQVKKQLLQDFPTALGNFLGAATGGKLPAATATQVLNAHEQDVQDYFYNYIKGDYNKAYDAFAAGDKRMYVIGTALADAIVRQMPEKFGGQAAPSQPSTPSNDMTKVWMKVGSKQLNINGKVTQMDTTPFLWNNWTFIPLRNLSEGIGAKVSWDAKTDTIWVKAGGDTLTFWVGKDYMMVNDVRKEIGTPVMIKNDRTVVPLRFITELLGWDVNFQKSDKSITLTKSMS
jgi:hemoglobin-like flavoprotein